MGLNHRMLSFWRWTGLAGLLAALYLLWPASADLSAAPGDRLEPAALPASLASQAARIVDGDLLRVGLSSQTMSEMEYPAAHISATGAFGVTGKNSGQVFLKDATGVIIRVTRTAEGFTLANGQQTLASKIKEPLLFSPASANSRLMLPAITRYGKIPQYRGVLEVTPGYSSPLKFSVVNVLPLQDYLKAVVPNELPMRYGLEAVRAQAVAARNYALRPRDKVWPQFDICDSQYCQAYYGAQTETPGTDKSLEETEGNVALYDGQIILALYSSSHGGYGEAYSNAFSDPLTKQYPAPPLPYLPGGADIALDKAKFGGAADLSNEAAARKFWTDKTVESFDVKSPHYRWQVTWTRPQLEALLNQTLREGSSDKLTKDFIRPALQAGSAIGTLKRLNITRRGVSGKAMTLEIVANNGTWRVEKEFTIRKILKNNGRMLNSANIVVDHLTDVAGQLIGVKIQGGGFGHGVGMSQLGASWMHDHGYSFDQIIQHYYKRVAITSIPLRVGEGGDATAMRHTFYVKRPEQARLVIRSDDPSRPVYVQVNDTVLQARPAGSSGELRLPLGAYVRGHMSNTLVLFPDPERPKRAISAWVELYPAKG